MRIVGLTGGMGMGKSTASAFLRRLGLPVFDADRVVHQLQAPTGAGFSQLVGMCPELLKDGQLDRDGLRYRAANDKAFLAKLENIMHPLVRKEREIFLQRCRRRGEPLVVLDVPLLFETAGDEICDQVITISAPRAVQRQRIIKRRGMSIAQAEALIARQMPDRERRRRADIVVRNGLSRAHTIRQLKRILVNLRSKTGGL